MIDGNFNDITIDSLHAKISEILGSQWGIGWSYQIREFKGYPIHLDLDYRFKGRNNRIEVLGPTMPSALESALYLLSKSIERDNEAVNKKAAEKTPAPAQWVPSADDLGQMERYFFDNPSVYEKRFASQISQQIHKPYSLLSIDEKLRLCQLWKTYMKTIDNE